MSLGDVLIKEYLVPRWMHSAAKDDNMGNPQIIAIVFLSPLPSVIISCQKTLSGSMRLPQAVSYIIGCYTELVRSGGLRYSQVLSGILR